MIILCNVKITAVKNLKLVCPLRGDNYEPPRLIIIIIIIIKVIPVIIGATGTISKSFRKYVSNIPGNHKFKELQKTAILGTAHILRKVLT
jgi:hypothetical protein